MKDLASWALDTAKLRGASLAEARIVDERSRSLATKNGKLGAASDSESLGIGIRVVAEGAFGFAATDVLTREGIQACAARAVEIAKASAWVKSQELHMVPEPAAKADWSAPCKIDPFTISIEKNLDLLIAIDREMRAGQGGNAGGGEHEFPALRAVVLLHRGLGDSSDQVLQPAPAMRPTHLQGTEIQKRSYPNSFGGQWQNKGYELIEELKLLENARRSPNKAVALHKAEQCPEGKFDHHSGFVATGPADSRVRGASDRTGSRAGYGGKLCRHFVSHPR